MVLILWKKECKFAKTLLLLCVLQNVLDLKYVRSIKEVLVPTLIAVHPENDPNGNGFEQAKAMPYTGGHKAGVLNSSFVAEVKSDLMGEQTILCGMLQTGSILCLIKWSKELNLRMLQRIQYGWETVTEALKHGYEYDGSFE
jgi:ketol-acid reductoisomerase